VSVARRNLKEA